MCRLLMRPHMHVHDEQVLEKEPQLIKALTDNARLMSKGLAKIRGLKVR